MTTCAARAIVSRLIDELNVDLNNIKSIDIVVSFIQLSGLKLIKDFLDDAINRGIPIRFITSTYMNISDPTALMELYYLLGEERIHLYNGGAPSFHPKAYLFVGARGQRLHHCRKLQYFRTCFDKWY